MPIIRLATEDDAVPIRSIYGYFRVTDSHLSFKSKPPTVKERDRRIARTLEWSPWLVCEESGLLLESVDAGGHSERVAYRWSVNVSARVAKPHWPIRNGASGVNSGSIGRSAGPWRFEGRVREVSRSMRNRVTRVVLWSLTVLAAGVWVEAADGPDDGASTTLRDGFESPKVAWRQERTDATVKIYTHERSNRAAHEGQQSEQFQFEADGIGGLYFSYKLPNIPVTRALKVGLYLRSNRSGAQLLGRVILPDDIDPDSRAPSYVMVPGTVFENSDRWQKLELAEMLPSIELQAKVLRASTKRPVSLKGAYLERLVVNLYGGEGETEVFLDELTVGPIPPALASNPRGESPRGPSVRTIADRPRGPNEPLEPVAPGLNTRIKLDRNRLIKDGYPWFFTAVRAPDADPERLRRVGCDVLVTPSDASEATIRKAIASGMLLVPELTGPENRTMPEADRLLSEASTFVGRDAVAFWSLGENLGRATDLETRLATLRRVREAERAFRKAKPGGSSLTTATVSGMLPEYARLPENLDVVGIPTAAWATSQDHMELFHFLEQRRYLTARGNSDALFWATIDATPPSIYQESIWGFDEPPTWGLPRVQPEQIRVATYAAIAAGCRGLCFRADSDLTREVGRPALIEMALLNEEIDLLEPILADPDKAVRMLDTYLPNPPPLPPLTLFQMNTGTMPKIPTPKEFPPHPSIKAAAITTKDRRGTLLMVADYAKYGQYQPTQGAFNNIKLLVPAPSDAHAYLITPGGVRAIDSIREPGGIGVTLADFGLSAIVLVTTNVDLKSQIEQAVNRNRVMAINLAIEQAELLRNWVAEIDALIQDLRHPQKESADLLNQATKLINSASEALAREDYALAWDEVRRVGRPLRILMRYHFMAAYDAIIKDLNDIDLPCGPVAYDGQPAPKKRIIQPIVAAPLASFSTLPQAWVWHDWIRTGKLGRNLVPSGHFDDKDAFRDAGWTPVSYKTDDIETDIQINFGGANMNVKNDPDIVMTKLQLFANPKKGMTLDSLVPFVDHPVVAVRSPAVKVGARQVYRISVMVKLANLALPGAGGLIIRDSIGGERLQFRARDVTANDWYEAVYYRRVPADGTLTVTLGMAGYGYASFDDFKIEPIVEQVDADQYKQLSARRRPARPPVTATPTSGSTVNPPARISAGSRTQPMPIRQ